ncbi:hypothetical protein Trydic_g10083 [Trypoxylus dichotomus]
MKSKITKNSEHLKEEYEAVLLLLNNVLEKDKQAGRYISSLSDKDISANKKYLLNVIEYQALAIQKMLEIGVELDEFSGHTCVTHTDGSLHTSISRSEVSLGSITYASDASISNIEKTASIDEDKIKLPVEPVLLKPGDGKVKKKVESSKKTRKSSLSPRKSTKKKEIESINPDKQKPSLNNVCGVEICEETAAVSSKSDMRNESMEKMKNLIRMSKDSNTSLVQLTQFTKDVSVDKLDKGILENGSSSDASSTSNKNNKISSADISSSEDVSLKEKRKTIQEKLKSKKLMTRRDRFQQNIQRPDIPDLSFKPSSKAFQSNDNYITCPESSSSTSVVQVKDRKRKKKRTTEKVSISSSSETGLKPPPEPRINLDYLVSRIVSPSEFYINLLDENIAVIDTMSYQLAEIFKDSGSPYQDKKSAMEALGNQCVCYLPEYECWYRVIVTSWRLNARDYQEKFVRVFLVDYGHTCSTSFENLRELTEEFCLVPQYAIKCHLAWLYPPGSTKNNLLDIWPVQSLDYFRSLFSIDSAAVYKVVYTEKCGNSWGIDIMFTHAEDEDLTFGQLMLDNKMAVEIYQDPVTMFKNRFIVEQIKTAQGLAGIASGMNEEEKLDRFNKNLKDHECGSIDQAMLNYRATDEARICKHARPDGTCFKGRRCKLEHGEIRQDGITTDKQCVYVSAFKQLEMPVAGATVKLRIVNIVNVNTFYACLINSQSEGLKNLISTMNKRDTISKYKSLPIPPAPGEIVIAKNWNNHWYRARVRDLYHYSQNAEETVQVFFVDLGDIVDVKMSDLKTITPELLYLPFQAIFCRLYNVKPIEDRNEDESKYYAESHFLCQIFDAEVVHASNSTLEVLLKKEDTSEDVGEQIIEDGFGELRVKHEFPIMTESMLVD